jgi:hypothetical protein
LRSEMKHETYGDSELLCVKYQVTQSKTQTLPRWSPLREAGHLLSHRLMTRSVETPPRQLRMDEKSL